MTVSLIQLKEFLPYPEFKLDKILANNDRTDDIMYYLFVLTCSLRTNVDSYKKYVPSIVKIFSSIYGEYDGSEFIKYLTEAIQLFNNPKPDMEYATKQLNLTILYFCQEFVLCEHKIGIDGNDVLSKLADDLNVNHQDFFPTYKLLVLLLYKDNSSAIQLAEYERLQLLIEIEFYFSITMTAKIQVGHDDLPVLFSIYKDDCIEVKTLKSILRVFNLMTDDVKQFYGLYFPLADNVEQMYNCSIGIKVMLKQLVLLYEYQKYQRLVYLINRVIYVLQDPAQYDEFYQFYSVLMYKERKETFQEIFDDDDRLSNYLMKVVYREEFADCKNNQYYCPNFRVMLLMFCASEQTDFDDFVLDELSVAVEEMPEFQFSEEKYLRDMDRGRQSPQLLGARGTPENEQLQLTLPSNNQELRPVTQVTQELRPVLEQAAQEYQRGRLQAQLPDGTAQGSLSYYILEFTQQEPEVNKFIKAYLSRNPYKIADVDRAALPDELQQFLAELGGSEVCDIPEVLSLECVRGARFCLYTALSLQQIRENDFAFEHFVQENCNQRYSCEIVYDKYEVPGSDFCELVRACIDLDEGRPASVERLSRMDEWVKCPTAVQNRINGIQHGIIITEGMEAQLRDMARFNMGKYEEMVDKLGAVQHVLAQIENNMQTGVTRSTAA